MTVKNIENEFLKNVIFKQTVAGALHLQKQFLNLNVWFPLSKNVRYKPTLNY